MPRVLLVDTEPHIVALLKSRFEQEGFEVVSLGEAQVQGQRILEAEPDLIICGRYRSGDEDIKAFKDLLAVGGVPAVPVIMLTTSDGVAADDVETDVAQLKMPFRPSQLLDLARKRVATA